MLECIPGTSSIRIRHIKTEEYLYPYGWWDKYAALHKENDGIPKEDKWTLKPPKLWKHNRFQLYNNYHNMALVDTSSQYVNGYFGSDEPTKNGFWDLEVIEDPN